MASPQQTASTTPNDKITIHVKDLHGVIISFEVRPGDTVEHLKDLCEPAFDRPVDIQRLILKGRQCRDGDKLEEVSLETVMILLPFGITD